MAAAAAVQDAASAHPPRHALPLQHPQDCSFAARSVRVGGMDKAALLAALAHDGVAMNGAAKALFAHHGFTTTASPALLWTVDVTVAALGLPQGATIAALTERAAALGLVPCPLELGPHLRLQYRDQAEGHRGHPPTQHRAPPGALTVVSAPIDGDDDVPKGFYLRRIDGVLWLRGYRAQADHVWSPQDHLVFAARPSGPGENNPASEER